MSYKPHFGPISPLQKNLVRVQLKKRLKDALMNGKLTLNT